MKTTTNTTSRKLNRSVDRITKGERMLIEMEKTLRTLRKQIAGAVRELSVGSRHAVKDMPVATERRGLGSPEIAFVDVVDAISLFAIERADSGWHLCPPAKKLSPKLWNRVKKLIEDNGGQWVIQRQKFWTEEDPSGWYMSTIMAGKAVNLKKERQAFYTPEETAKQVVKLAKVVGKSVLEPSSGEGSLALECRKQGASYVVCNEIDKACYIKLRDMGFAASNGDFLEVVDGIAYYDRVVMNPPFTKDAYVKHIAHAMKFLAPDGRLVSVIPGKEVSPKLKKALDKFSCHYDIYVLPKHAFRESGTDVQCSVLVVDKKRIQALK